MTAQHQSTSTIGKQTCNTMTGDVGIGGEIVHACMADMLESLGLNEREISASAVRHMQILAGEVKPTKEGIRRMEAVAANFYGVDMKPEQSLKGV